MPLWVDTASMQLLAALGRSADHDPWHHCPFWTQFFLVFDQNQPGSTGLSLRRVTCGFTCVTHGELRLVDHLRQAREVPPFSPLLTASYAVTAGLAHSFHLEGGNCTLMSLSLGVLHTRLIPISFGYPYVSRQLVALACAQRRGQSRVLSVADTRLSDAVSPLTRADPTLSSLQDPSGLDAGLLGRPDGPWRYRHLWDRIDPS